MYFYLPSTYRLENKHANIGFLKLFETSTCDKSIEKMERYITPIFGRDDKPLEALLVDASTDRCLP